MSEAPWVAVLCGPTGSGKSTFALQLARHTGCLVASTDAMRMALFGGKYPAREHWARTRDLVYSIVDDVIVQSLRGGFAVVVDGTHLTPQARARSLMHAHPGRAAIISFDAEYDNTGEWAARGYDLVEAEQIRKIHSSQFLAPEPSEATHLLKANEFLTTDHLLARWPFPVALTPGP